MAIDPTILKKNLDDAANSYEDKLDLILCDEVIYGNSVTIPAPESMSYAHFQILKPKYIAAGWADLAWRDHQRDGKSITFKTTKD